MNGTFGLRIAPLVLAAACSACVVPRQMFASPDDLTDYRAYRVAAHEGRRLYEAQRYLEKHPHGAFVDEVRAVFDAEEPAWFEAAKTSRARAREYVVDLPDGPHAEAARALMVLFDEHQDDVETTLLLAQVRRTGAMLDYESGRRKRVSDVVLEEIGALADPATWGARLDAPPPALAGVMRGDVTRTWGGGGHADRTDSLYFVVPTPTGALDRVVEVTLQIWLENGRVAQGVLQGDDLFVTWTEAMLVKHLEPAERADRALAAATVADVLGGAFEAVLPGARCKAPLQPGEVFARACDGWTVSARMGAGPGVEDVVDVRGPRPKGP